MIKSFADKRTQTLFVTGKAPRLHPALAKRALRRLEFIHLAARLDDLKVPPSNRLHALSGDRKGQYAIRVNDSAEQGRSNAAGEWKHKSGWRICFSFVDGDAHDVELTDYH